MTGYGSKQAQDHCPMWDVQVSYYLPYQSMRYTCQMQDLLAELYYNEIEILGSDRKWSHLIQERTTEYLSIGAYLMRNQSKRYFKISCKMVVFSASIRGSTTPEMKG